MIVLVPFVSLQFQMQIRVPYIELHLVHLLGALWSNSSQNLLIQYEVEFQVTQRLVSAGLLLATADVLYEWKSKTIKIINSNDLDIFIQQKKLIIFFIEKYFI